MNASVTDNSALHRFELPVGGQTAFLTYDRTPDSIRLLHTEVPDAFRGRGFGETLVKGALDRARTDGLKVVAVCPFVRAYLKKHRLDQAQGKPVIPVLEWSGRLDEGISRAYTDGVKDSPLIRSGR